MNFKKSCCKHHLHGSCNPQDRLKSARWAVLALSVRKKYSRSHRNMPGVMTTRESGYHHQVEYIVWLITRNYRKQGPSVNDERTPNVRDREERWNWEKWKRTPNPGDLWLQWKKKKLATENDFDLTDSLLLPSYRSIELLCSFCSTGTHGRFDGEKKRENSSGGDN